jgi:PIN domain nuclease of toxin-antitoxin system
MNLLLDTHAFLWHLSGDSRMSVRVLELSRDAEIQLYLSVAVAWEIAMKYQLGKLRLPQPPRDFLTEARWRMRFIVLPIELSHVVRSAELEWHHRDPFDRLLIAQAQIEGLAIATADSRIARYGIQVVW